MDRSKTAELLLSCVLPGDRAAAVAGDFTEEFEGHGGFGFWSSVIRTMVAAVAGDLVRRPLSLSGIGFGGCLLIIAPVIVLALIAAPFARYGHRWILDVIAAIMVLPWRVQCGRLLARWNAPSAMTACVAVIAVGWMWIAIVHTTPPRSTIALVMCGVQDILLVSGALWERYRNLRLTWRPTRA